MFHVLQHNREFYIALSVLHGALYLTAEELRQRFIWFTRKVVAQGHKCGRSFGKHVKFSGGNVDHHDLFTDKLLMRKSAG